MNLRRLWGWIFDMDGTLTVPIHDFDRIRARLELPKDGPILEAIAELPRGKRAQVVARLDEIEFEIASQAEPRRGAAELLDALRARGARMGILTRNSRDNALETLRVCGLLHFFEPGNILGRESVAPKPDPEGIRKLLQIWALGPDRAAVVGDYVFDMQAGRGAGVATIFLGREPDPAWLEHIDICVEDLLELREMIRTED
jgi:HAD superfamily hydrolase (TIGR01509 family)